MIIYLNAWPNEVRRLKSFVPELVSQLIVVCPPQNLASFHSDNVRAFAVENFDATTIALSGALDFPVTGIFADSEDHMVAAAELRGKLGICGQSVESAVAFRDKKIMYELVAQANPKFFRLIPQISDPLSANTEKNYIIKPRAGTDSQGVRLISGADLSEVSIDVNLNVIQEFVPHEVWHVDGLVAQGKVAFQSVTRYHNSCLSYKDGKLLGGICVTQVEERERLTIAAKELIESLPYSNNMIFHAEFLVSGDLQDIVFLEVACRSGGGCGVVVNSIEYNYGINLTKELLQLEAGAPWRREASFRADGKEAAYLIIPRGKQCDLSDPAFAGTEILFAIRGEPLAESETAGEAVHTSLSGDKIVFSTPIGTSRGVIRKIERRFF